MKISLKYAALLGAVSIFSGSPAYAGTISSPANSTPITATGTFVIDMFGNPSTFNICSAVSLSGYVESGSGNDKMTFTSGSLNCSKGYEIILPFSLEATSSTQVTADNISVDAPTGTCGSAYNVAFSWSGSTATRSTTVPVSFCNVTFFGLNISPAVTIL